MLPTHGTQRATGIGMLDESAVAGAFDRADSSPRTAARPPLRILEIGTSGSVGTAEMGPVSRTINTLANGFHRVGHAVTVADKPASSARADLDAGIRVEQIGTAGAGSRAAARLPGSLQPLASWARARAFTRTLLTQVRLEHFDAVHVHDPHVAWFLMRSAPRARCYYTSHSSSWALDLDLGRNVRGVSRLESVLERTVIKRACATIALADYLRRWVPPARIEVIPNAIDASLWRPLDHVASRRALGIPDDAFVALFVGRIHFQKGVDLLMEAVREIAADLRRLHVVAIGSLSGDYSSSSRVTAYSRQVLARARGLPVRFEGFLSNSSRALREWLSAADVAVFPSRTEPFGYVALEALAMSLPVIATRSGGLGDTVTPDVGFLIPPDDVPALAGALRRAHDHPELLAQKRARCRDRVLKSFTIEAFVQHHLELFRDTLVAPGRTS